MGDAAEQQSAGLGSEPGPVGAVVVQQQMDVHDIPVVLATPGSELFERVPEPLRVCADKGQEWDHARKSRDGGEPVCVSPLPGKL